MTPHIFVISRIGDYAFAKCNLNSSITIPGTVTEIGEYAFESSKFNGIEFQPGLLYINDWAFHEVPLEKVVLPESLIKLGRGSFAKCNKLQEIDLPSTLMRLEGSTFRYCDNLKKIICRAEIPPHADNTDFGRGNHITTPWNGVDDKVPVESCVLYVPKESVELYMNAPGWSLFYSTTENGETIIHDNIKTIEDDLPLADTEEENGNEEQEEGVSYVADKGEVSVFCQAGDELTICNSEGICLLREKISEPRVVTHRGEGIRIISLNGNSVNVTI